MKQENSPSALKSGSKGRGQVNALGSAGSSVGAADNWKLIFHLAAWRHDGIVSRGELRSEMPVSKAALKEPALGKETRAC